mmetsp:Transcript_72263/g.193272  ORF Transcript_72263/g.193272 Transcript_72263/m.193272 type:complete len:156 (+) Transcript_72263:682-1149(+)
MRRVGRPPPPTPCAAARNTAATHVMARVREMMFPRDDLCGDQKIDVSVLASHTPQQCLQNAPNFKDQLHQHLGAAAYADRLWSLQGILGMTIGTTVMLVALLVLAYVCFNGLDLAVVYSKRRGRLRNVAWQPRRAYDPGRDLAGLPTAVGAAAKM